MKSKTFGILIALIVLISGISFTYYKVTAPEPYYNYIGYDSKDYDGSSMGITLIIEHRDSLGRLKGTTIKENDYFLENMAFFVKRLFTGNIAYTDASLQPVATDGTSEILWYNSNTGNIRHGASAGEIGFGTSTSAVSLQDYELGTLVTTQTVSSISTVSTGTQINGTYTTTFNIGASYAVSEFGLYTSYYHDNSALKDFLLCRDVISPVINVVSGDTLTVTYIWQYN